MNTSRSFVVRFVGALVVVLFGGWVCGGTINLLAALSPQMVSKIDCPAGSAGRVEWKQLSFNQYGEKTMVVTCLDSTGNAVTPLTDAQSRAIEYTIFYPAGVVVMALIVSGLLIFWRSRAARAASSPQRA